MGLSANGLALLILAIMFMRGYASSRWGLAAVVLAAASLPMLGPIGEMVRTVLAAFVPTVNAVATSGAVG